MASSPNRTLIRKFLDAVWKGKFKLVKRLALQLNEKGIDVANAKDRTGRMALHMAANNGFINICKYLIEELKIDVNIKDEEANTPLHFATTENHLPTVKYLLEIGADLNKRDWHNWTALHVAAMRGHTELMRLLISKGAVVDAEVDNDNGTALLMAVNYGQIEAVKILLEHNANPNMIFNGVNVNSPLTIAILKRSYECVRILLESGADTNIGSCGGTPIENGVSVGDLEILKLLLKAGASPNILNMYGDSPIETAAFHRNLELIEMLLPITTHNPKVQDWSCLGLIKYIHSDEVKDEKKMKRREYFLFAKSKGDEELKNKNYLRAMNWYTEAMTVAKIDSVTESDTILLSNRSLCFAKINEGPRALIDAMACVRLRPDWPVAHYRVGVAYFVMKLYRKAVVSFSDGLELDPNNKELEDSLWKAARADKKQMAI